MRKYRFQALEQAAQGGGGITISGSVQKACKCGMWRFGAEYGD